MMNDFVFVSTIQTSLTFKRNQTFLIFNPPYSEAVQNAKIQSFRSNPERGLPGSNLNTSGSSVQSDRSDKREQSNELGIRKPLRDDEGHDPDKDTTEEDEEAYRKQEH